MTEEGNRATKVDESGSVQVGGACEQRVTCSRGGGGREDDGGNAAERESDSHRRCFSSISSSTFSPTHSASRVRSLSEPAQEQAIRDLLAPHPPRAYPVYPALPPTQAYPRPSSPSPTRASPIHPAPPPTRAYPRPSSPSPTRAYPRPSSPSPTQAYPRPSRLCCSQSAVT